MMPEHPNSSVAEQERQTDATVLDLLRTTDNQRPWAVDEVEREAGSDAVDSLNRLYGAGLIHRLDGFVWASRAAIMAEALQM